MSNLKSLTICVTPTNGAENHMGAYDIPHKLHHTPLSLPVALDELLGRREFGLIDQHFNSDQKYLGNIPQRYTHLSPALLKSQ